jgi:phytoene dehydrogenase-like protein
MKKNKKVLIVGTGIGGLTAGLRLVKRGYDVEFVEKYFQAGGRLNQIKKEGFVFDTGPSFFTMSYVFKDFAKDCGINLPFSYEELDPLFSINLDNKKVFNLYKDIKKLSKQFENIEENFEQKFIDYLKKSEDIFNETFNKVIQKKL